MTKESSSAKTPGYIDAEAGMFVRETNVPPDIIVPLGYRYMRSCNGKKGLVSRANIQKLNATDKMPTKKTDPTADKFSLLSALPNPLLPRTLTGPCENNPHGGLTNKGDSNQKKATQGAIAQEDTPNEEFITPGAKQVATTRGKSKIVTDNTAEQLEDGEIDEGADSSEESNKKKAEKGIGIEGHPTTDKETVKIPRGITTEDPRIDPPFRMRLFKLFRVIPPTTKAGKSGEVSQEILPDHFQFNEGDFMLDLKDRGDRTARVRDINGQEGDVRLRRLQALKNPWNLPDRLPLAPRRNYVVPETDPDVIVLAQFLDEKKEMDFSSTGSIRTALRERLAAKKRAETMFTVLARITKNVPPANKTYRSSCQKGEIVRVSKRGEVQEQTKLKSYLVVNYEGYENMVPEDSIEELKTLFWGLAPLWVAECKFIKSLSSESISDPLQILTE